VSDQPAIGDGYALERYRDYLRLLASHQLAARFKGKVDPSGVVQETLWEAHRELAGGAEVQAGQRLPWLRRILANNLADEVRRMTAERRDVGREVSFEVGIETSSRRLEQWLAHDVNPAAAKEDDGVLRMVAALARLPEAQREAIILQYWSGLSYSEIAEQLGRSREAVAGLIKRALQQLRSEIGATSSALLGDESVRSDTGAIDEQQ